MGDNGKIKENNAQIFVRNLSYQVTEEDLLQCFQEFGPVKNCTVAMHHGKPKGFGFVKFALEEDARAALSARQLFPLQGRNLKLEIAIKQSKKASIGTEEQQQQQAGDALPGSKNKKRPLEDKDKDKDKEEPPAAEKKIKAKRVKAESKETKTKKAGQGSEEEKADADADADAGPSRQRQLLVLGLPAEVCKKDFQRFLQQMKGLRRGARTLVELIKESHDLCASLREIVHPAGKVLLVTAASRVDAGALKAGLESAPAALKVLREISKAHRIQLKQKTGQQQEEGEGEGEDSRSGSLTGKKGERLVVRALTALTAPDLRKRRCRVIVRNLSFEVSVEVPKVSKAAAAGAGAEAGAGAGAGKMRPRGFAFVTFLCEQDAAAAVKESAATALKVCNREVAVDLCLSKESYVKAGAGAAGAAHDDAAAEENDEEEEEEEEEQKRQGDDDDYDGGGGQVEDEDDEDEFEPAPVEEGEEEGEGEGEGEDSDPAQKEDEEDEEGGPGPGRGPGPGLGRGEAAGPAPVRRSVPVPVPVDDVSEGLTVFLRDLPYDCRAAAVSSALAAFGPLSQAAVLVPNKGSAFAKFRDRSAVERCLAAARAGAGGISVDGRCCRVDLAVDRQTAQRLGQEQRPRDKRNLYLAAVEGAALTLTAAGGDPDPRKDDKDSRDRDKRINAQAEKRKKLQNPLFFVSGQRLSVRNLGKEVTDQQLRTVALRALKAALAGDRVSQRDLEAFVAAQGRELAQAANAGADPLQVPPFSPKAIRSVKVMRETGKGPGDLLPRSKGFGFVEFGSHAHALAVLREMDGSGRYREIAHDGRPIVEFTIENIRKVKILEERKQRSDKRKAAEGPPPPPRSDGPGPEPEPENRAAQDAGPQDKNTTATTTRADSRTKSSKDSRQDKHQQKQKRKLQRSGSGSGDDNDSDRDRDRNSSGAAKRRKISEEPRASTTQAQAGSQERKEKAKKLTLRQRELLKQRQRKDAKKQKQQQQQPLAHD